MFFSGENDSDMECDYDKAMEQQVFAVQNLFWLDNKAVSMGHLLGHLALLGRIFV